MALTDADLVAALSRLNSDSDAALTLLRAHVAETATVAQSISLDRQATQTAATRTETAASSVGAGATNTVIAQEGENFTVEAGTLVRFGAGSSWVEATFDGSPHVCNGPTFGATVDPAPGQVKQCVLGHYQG